MYKLLSYPLNFQTPLYGNIEPIQIKIKEQDSIMTARISFSNHSGTHLDAPRHFFKSGRSISDYSIEELIFNSPLLIDCPKKENELITIDDLKSIRDCDLLLIRTGFYKYRGSEKYRLCNPGISPETAEWIRRNHPAIRAIGIDTISISAFQKREVGRRAHQILLKSNGFPGDPVLLIEDLNLSGEFNKLKKVYAIPLFIEGVDSMTCTVIGEF